MNKKMAAFLIKAILGTAVASAYLGASLFFMDSFYYGTSVGNFDIGGYTVEGAQAAISQRGKSTSLALYGRGSEKQVLKGEDINLVYHIEGSLQKYKEAQSPFLWPKLLVEDGKLPVKQTITYDQQMLSKAVDQLSFFQEENIVPPEDAKVIFNGSEYEIEPESQGKKLNKEATVKAIVQALKEGKTAVNLDKEDCYEKPKVTETSPEIVTAKKLINESLYTEVVYLFGDKKESVTPEMLSSWMSVDENQEISVDEQKVSEYISSLAATYDTFGGDRQFKTSSGEVVTVSGGDYGWSINQKAETQALIHAIKTGERINREPIANSNGAQSYVDNDFGGSYVEISLTQQHLWLYKNGVLITEGDVVTGDKNRNRQTPQGTYKLDYKMRNAVLRGPGYACPVSFWMPFNGGIGIHDAVWRGSFGGKIYVYDGSHGCVNAPYSLAQKVFNNIDETMPIICHY